MTDKVDMVFQMVRDIKAELEYLSQQIDRKPCLPHKDCAVVFAGRTFTYRVLTALSVATVVLGCTLIMIEGPQALDMMLNILGKIK